MLSDIITAGQGVSELVSGSRGGCGDVYSLVWTGFLWHTAAGGTLSRPLV